MEVSNLLLLRDNKHLFVSVWGEWRCEDVCDHRPKAWIDFNILMAFGTQVLGRKVTAEFIISKNVSNCFKMAAGWKRISPIKSWSKLWALYS